MIQVTSSTVSERNRDNDSDRRCNAQYVANSRIRNRVGRTDVNDSGLGFRKPSFIIVNGYKAEMWVIWAILGALLLAIGVVVVWRAA